MASDDTPPSTRRCLARRTPSNAATEDVRQKYDTNPALDESTGSVELPLRDPSLLASVIKETYSRNEPRLKRIARKYRLLSAIFDEQDLMQEAFLGLLASLENYRINPDGEMRFLHLHGVVHEEYLPARNRQHREPGGALRP